MNAAGAVSDGDVGHHGNFCSSSTVPDVKDTVPDVKEQGPQCWRREDIEKTWVEAAGSVAGDAAVAQMGHMATKLVDEALPRVQGQWDQELSTLNQRMCESTGTQMILQRLDRASNPEVVPSSRPQF
jgi:hypothetical protein